MRYSEHHSDPARLIEVDRKRVAHAFDHWSKLQGRARRGSGVHAPALFYKAVQESLDLSRGEVPKSLKIPTGRSGWHNWRCGTGKPTGRIRFDVCWAIWMLSNIDVTSNGFLQQVPVNATEMVRLGKAQMAPSRSEIGMNELSVHELQITSSSAKDIWLSDAKQKPCPQDKTIRIGDVRYGLREVSLGVQCSETPHTILTHLGSGEENPFGVSRGAVLSVDPDDLLRWRIQPPITEEIIQARFENLKLIKSETASTPVSVTVSVAENDVYPRIGLEDSSPHVRKLSSKARELARQRLIEQVLRHRLVENGVRRRYVLSQSKASFE